MSPLAADTDRALFKRFCTPLQPVETVADAARAVASRLIEGPALAVIGHSFGGTAACLATCDGPVSGRRIETGTLVTISAPATLRTMTERFLRPMEACA